MRLGYWGSAHCVLPVVGVLLLVVGCGHRAPHETSPVEAAKTADVPLPEWAPPNPSPEFMRAARVIKPWPTEITIAGESDLAAKAFNARFRRCLVPAWEFFGSLTDDQIGRFRATRDLRIQVKDLTDKQRAALYRVFDTWREQMKGVPDRPEAWGTDWLVELYKAGAKEDLSNVEIQFVVRARGRVVMFLRACLPDGSLSYPNGMGLGHM